MFMNDVNTGVMLMFLQIRNSFEHSNDVKCPLFVSFIRILSPMLGSRHEMNTYLSGIYCSPMNVSEFAFSLMRTLTNSSTKI